MNGKCISAVFRSTYSGHVIINKTSDVYFQNPYRFIGFTFSSFIHIQNFKLSLFIKIIQTHSAQIETNLKMYVNLVLTLDATFSKRMMFASVKPNLYYLNVS